MADRYHASILDSLALEYCDRVSLDDRYYRPLGLLADGILLEDVTDGESGETIHVETDYLAEHLTMGIATYEREYFKYGKSAR